MSKELVSSGVSLGEAVYVWKYVYEYQAIVYCRPHFRRGTKNRSGGSERLSEGRKKKDGGGWNIHGCRWYDVLECKQQEATREVALGVLVPNLVYLRYLTVRVSTCRKLSTSAELDSSTR